MKTITLGSAIGGSGKSALIRNLTTAADLARDGPLRAMVLEARDDPKQARNLLILAFQSSKVLAF